MSKSATAATGQTAFAGEIQTPTAVTLDEDHLLPPSFVIRPLSEFKKERDLQDAVRDLREFQKTLRVEPSGSLVIRDAGGIGPEVIPEWLRWAAGRTPRAWFIVTHDDGALLPVSEREAWDWGYADDSTVDMAKAGVLGWRCTIFTTPTEAPRWKVWIAHYNREAWIYSLGHEGSRCLQEGSVAGKPENLPRGAE